jgi:hypothetical protein
VGIEGIDTRALVRHLREGGAMNGAIASDGTAPLALLERVRAAPSMDGLNLAEGVSTREPYRWTSLCPAEFDARLQPQPDRPYRVVAIDFGIKRAILERLVAHGCEVTVLPADSGLEDVLRHEPEGVFLSNGPGDPAAVQSGIALAAGLIEQGDLPLFGICLGHQILGLALGGRTFKLGYGHRGLNHPCGAPGSVEITSQNHGFALDAASAGADLPPQPQRPHRGGPGDGAPAGDRGAVPPGGQPWPPRRGPPLRSLCGIDGGPTRLKRLRGFYRKTPVEAFVSVLPPPEPLPTLPRDDVTRGLEPSPIHPFHCSD